MPIQLSDTAVSAWARLVRAQQLLLEQIEADLKHAGLPGLAWYDVLLELQRQGSIGLRQYELAAAVLLKKHNLSRLLDRLSNAGLIERLECDSDKRGSLVVITGDGRAMLKKMWRVYARALERNFAGLYAADELATINSLLAKIPGVAR